MPVRIYDIAKKLGIESKEVLAKAKELGVPVMDEAGMLELLSGQGV